MLRSLARLGLLPLGIGLLMVAFGALEPRFLTLSNFQNIVFQAGILALTAFGQFFPVLAGGIDFTVGGVLSLTSVIAARTMLSHGVVAGIAAALMASALVGLANGLLVVKFRASPMIITLGMLWVVLGITLVISNGQVIYGLPESFRVVGISRPGGIPASALWAFGGFVLCYVLLHLTSFGRRLYAVGANERCAWLSGVRVNYYRVMAYVVCALFVAWAGIVLTACLGSGQPQLGIGGLDMQNFIAVFIAGTRWGGGEGSIVSVLLGVFLVAVLSNGLNVLNVSSYAQMVLCGLVLVAALTADMIRREGGWRLRVGFRIRRLPGRRAVSGS